MVLSFLSFIRPLTHSLKGTLVFVLSVFVTGSALKLLVAHHELFSVGELVAGGFIVLGLALVTLYAYLVLAATEVRHQRNRR